MFRSSVSSRSLTPNAAAVSARPTTLRLITYGTRASSRCSRSALVAGCGGSGLAGVMPWLLAGRCGGSCQRPLEPEHHRVPQVGRLADDDVGAERGKVLGEPGDLGERDLDLVPAVAALLLPYRD